MKFSKLGLSLLALTFSTAFAGNGGSGGGQSVILPTGEVRFVDLLEVNKIPSSFMPRKQVMEKFFAKERYVKTLATEDKNFFQCAKEKLNLYKSDVPALNELSSELDKISVLRVAFPLIAKKDSDKINPKDLPLPLFASTSSRIDEKDQWAIASYQTGDLWVSNPLYKPMSSEDQCAVQVHEALRHLNFIGSLKNPLTTQDIEILTKGIMNNEAIEAPVPQWQSSLENLKEALASKNFNDTDIKDLVSGFSELRTLLEEEADPANCTPASKVMDMNPDNNELAALYSQYADVLQSYIIESGKYSNSLLNESQLARQISDSYILDGMDKVLNRQQEISKHGDGDAVIRLIATRRALTEELPQFEYFDVVEMKTVKRLKK